MSSTSLTLIQLVSEQTIPNLLPVLRLRPARLVHLVTAKTAGRSAALAAAARAAGLSPEIECLQLSAMPGVGETHNAVREILQRTRDGGGEAVVNFTGGTKLMSIGAFSAALRERAPSLYTDTGDACFVDGSTSPRMVELLEHDYSFTPIRSQLRVDVLAIANGVSRVTAGSRWEPLLPLARFLQEDPAAEQLSHDVFYGPRGLVPNGRGPTDPEGWLALLDRPVMLPDAVGTLAVEAGLLRAGADGDLWLPDATRPELEDLARARRQKEYLHDYDRRRMAATAPVQASISFFTGAWWEIVVMEAAVRTGLFRDLRWSVLVGDRQGPETEEDILGLDGVELLYVSCKRGGHGARLLPLLEELRARAATIGGAFNRRFLAVQQPLRGKVRHNLFQRAGELGITVLTADDLARSDLFSRSSPRP